MFENLIAQPLTTHRLVTEVENARLARALLFHGPRYSGKLTAALELARVLSCTEEGAWNCGCGNCQRHRLLEYQGLLMMGPRNFMEEILAASVSLKTSQKTAVRYVFLRAVGKLVRRFDEVLWQHDSSRLQKAEDRLSAVSEALGAISPGSRLPEGTDLDHHIDEIVDSCSKLVRRLGNAEASIGQVRSVASWLRSTTALRPKIVVIEGADSMLEGARNAFLKVLEEPPQDVYFILITERRGAIIPTILSRTRSYHFIQRSADEERRVIEGIFRIPSSEYLSLREFFLAQEYGGDYPMKRAAEAFLEEAIRGNGGGSVIADAVDLMNKGPSSAGLRHFLSEIAMLLSGILRAETRAQDGEPITAETLHAWSRLLAEHQARAESYNVSATNALESLYYGLRKESRA
jgi:DNA polymerase-3 subunit gamma/tau